MTPQETEESRAIFARAVIHFGGYMALRPAGPEGDLKNAATFVNNWRAFYGPPADTDVAGDSFHLLLVAVGSVTAVVTGPINGIEFMDNTELRDPTETELLAMRLLVAASASMHEPDWAADQIEALTLAAGPERAWDALPSVLLGGRQTIHTIGGVD